MNEILLIGPVGCGKTTLKKAILGQDLAYRKTQALDFSHKLIDCPGEYLEIPRYYHVIIDLSHRSSEIWALQSANSMRASYPPNFAKSFNRPVIGVITKSDRDDSDVEQAREFLHLAGITGKIWVISALTGEGIDGLKRRLKRVSAGHVSNRGDLH